MNHVLRGHLITWVQGNGLAVGDSNRFYWLGRHQPAGQDNVVKLINKVIRFDAVKTGKQQTMPGLTDQSSQQLLGLEAYGSVRAVSW